MTINCPIIPCTQEHLDRIKGRLRAVDKEEVEDTTGQSCDLVLQQSFEVSIVSYVVIANGLPVLVAGLAPHFRDEDKGIPWLLGTDEMGLSAVSKTIARYSKKMVNSFHDLFSELENYVGENNYLALRWLRWMGFDVGSPIELEGAKMRYRRIYRRVLCAVLPQ